MTLRTITIAKKQITISSEALSLLGLISELQTAGLIASGGDVLAQQGYGEGSIEVTIPPTVTWLGEAVLVASGEPEDAPSGDDLPDDISGIAQEAWDRIRNEYRLLQQRTTLLQETLKPFAEAADVLVDDEGWQSKMHNARISTWLGPSDFIRASKVLDAGSSLE